MRVHDQDKDTWIPVPFPPIVDEETWDAAQRIRKKRKIQSPRNTKIFYLLQHMVRCTVRGMLMRCLARRKRTVRRNGKAYKYELGVPHCCYKCYGMKRYRTGCRKNTSIRAERLEDLVWGEVQRVLENPSLIVAGLESLDFREEGGLEKQTARLERELQKVQYEEDRAIRLFVSWKITEGQLDHQRKFITERLETLRARLEDLRARETATEEKKAMGERVIDWARGIGQGLDSLPDEERRELLHLVLDGVTIEDESNVSITLGIPTGNLASIGNSGSREPGC